MRRANQTEHRITLVQAALTVLALCVLAFPAVAFTPPEDTAGPLTVRIEGPAEVTETETAVPVKVVIANNGAATTGRPDSLSRRAERQHRT